MNAYSYADSNPINYIDPDGLRFRFPTKIPRNPKAPGKGKGKGKGGKRPCSIYAIVDCHGEIVYIGQTYRDRLRQRENEHKNKGVIKKYSCPTCKLKFVGPIRTFSQKGGLTGCVAAETAMIFLMRPIFNDDKSPDSNRGDKVAEWQKENCCGK